MISELNSRWHFKIYKRTYLIVIVNRPIDKSNFSQWTLSVFIHRVHLIGTSTQFKLQTYKFKKNVYILRLWSVVCEQGQAMICCALGFFRLYSIKND